MPSITLNFSNPLNVSLQSGNIDNTTPAPVNGDFVFFAKNNVINTTGIIGYQAEIEMELPVASATSKKELFAVNSEVFISS